MASSVRHARSFARAMPDSGSPAAAACASSSSAVRYGYGSGVASGWMRAAPSWASSTTKPPPTE